MSDAALADVVLVVHAAFVAFVVFSLPAIWIGAAAGRPFARNRWFRAAHLAAIAIVVALTLLGIACPLTTWEDALRGRTQGEGFIERAIHAVMFWHAPAWAFATLYVAFGALVAWTWRRIPPR